LLIHSRARLSTTKHHRITRKSRSHLKALGKKPTSIRSDSTYPTSVSEAKAGFIDVPIAGERIERVTLPTRAATASSRARDSSLTASSRSSGRRMRGGIVPMNRGAARPKSAIARAIFSANNRKPAAIPSRFRPPPRSIAQHRGQQQRPWRVEHVIVAVPSSEQTRGKPDYEHVDRFRSARYELVFEDSDGALGTPTRA
jgi:hypothetical protein